MYSNTPVPKSCSPVSIAVSGPSLAFVFDVSCYGLEVTGVNVDTCPTANVRISSLGDLAGKPHATDAHQASLRATLSLALPIKSHLPYTRPASPFDGSSAPVGPSFALAALVFLDPELFAASCLFLPTQGYEMCRLFC